MVYSPAFFPDHGVASRIREPWVSVHSSRPSPYMNAIMQLLYEHEASMEDFKDVPRRTRVAFALHAAARAHARFFDALKASRPVTRRFPMN